jgi:endonuclease IV
MFGPHVSRVHAPGPRATLAAHVRAARAEAAAAGFDARAFQVFISGPEKMRITLSEAEATELRELLAGDPGLRVFAHGAYGDFPWSGAPFPLKFIGDELAVCARAGIAGLVIHLGKPPLAEVARVLPRLAAAVRAAGGPRLFLETPHPRPEHAHYAAPEQLAELARALRRVDPRLELFGLCVDTAHLWSSGVDLRRFEAADDWLRRFEAAGVPPDRLLFHLNDSREPLGRGVDRHAALFAGEIWRDFADRPGQSGLAAFVDFAVSRGVPAVLERKPPEALLDDYAALLRIAPAPALRAQK